MATRGRPVTVPRCYGCARKARPDSRFCSDRCAAGYAEELVAGNEDSFCIQCDAWVGDGIYAQCSSAGHTRIAHNPVYGVHYRKDD